MTTCTEFEAVQKICPTVSTPNELCCGSACMAWRWANSTQHYQQFVKAPNRGAQEESEAGIKPDHCKNWEFIPAHDDSAGWREPEATANLRRHGYCGMAGAPHLERQISSVIEMIAAVADK